MSKEPNKPEEKESRALTVPMLRSGMPVIPDEFTANYLSKMALILSETTATMEPDLAALGKNDRLGVVVLKLEKGRALGMTAAASMEKFQYYNHKVTQTTESKWGVIQSYAKNVETDIVIDIIENSEKRCEISVLRPHSIFKNKPQKFFWTIEMAHKSGLDDNAKKNKNPWVYDPQSMLWVRTIGKMSRQTFPDLFQEDCAYSTEEVADFEPYDMKYPNAIPTTAEAPKAEPTFNGAKPKVVKPAAIETKAEPETKFADPKNDAKIVAAPVSPEAILKAQIKMEEEQDLLSPEDFAEVEQAIAENQKAAGKTEVQQTIAPEPPKKVLVAETPKIAFAGNKPAVVKSTKKAEINTPAPVVPKTEDPKPVPKIVEKKPTNRSTKVKATYNPEDIEKAKADPKNQLEEKRPTNQPPEDYYASAKDSEGDVPSEQLLETLKECGIDYMQQIMPIRMGILKEKDWKSNCELVWACLDKLNLPNKEDIEKLWRHKMKAILDQMAMLIGNNTDDKIIYKLLTENKWTPRHGQWAVNYLRARKIIG